MDTRTIASGMTCSRRTVSTVRLITLLLVTLPAVACNDGEGSGTRTYENEGTVCLTPGGDSLTITVTFDKCLDGCELPRNQACMATVVDGDLRIVSSLQIVPVLGRDTCSDTCTFATATCELTASIDGQHQVLH